MLSINEYLDFVIRPVVQSKVKSERGASLVEYALIVALIAVVCIAAISLIGGRASTKFSSIGTKL